MKATMTVVHLTASPFYGGPERQMLGLARATPAGSRPLFLCFAEHGLARPFMEELDAHGVRAIELKTNFPHVLAAASEVSRYLRELGAGVVLCHGYKPDIIGYLAARKADIPAIGVSRGWTGASARVRFYEWMDRRVLRRMSHVVCVSEGQAKKVRAAGVAPEKVSVIRNSIDAGRFASPDSEGRQRLETLFTIKPRYIVLAVGRLSPEKGFERLIEAARDVRAQRPEVGFVLIGEGPLREPLQRQIDAAGLQSSFILAGFRRDVDTLMPHADLLVQSSYTEGLPNVVLEAMAAAVPVVATEVGGTGEVVIEGETGLLVRPGQSAALSAGMLCVFADEGWRRQLGTRGREHVTQHFTFEAQYRHYQRLLQQWLPAEPMAPAGQTVMVGG